MMLKLVATPRTETGKKLAGLRSRGFIPAVVYGPGTDTTENVSVEVTAFEAMRRDEGDSSLIELSGLARPQEVLIQDLTTDPVSGKVLHVDFYAVKSGEKVEVEVPLEFTGESAAVTDLGGMLVKVRYELTVECLPKDIPHEITVDLSLLKQLGDTIQIKDLKLPADVEVQAEAEEAVAIVEEPRDIEAEDAAAAEGSVDDVEVAGESDEAATEGEEGAEATASEESAE